MSADRSYDDTDYGPGCHAVVWDNLGDGWRMYCATDCSFATSPCCRLADAADELARHWADVHPPSS